METKEHKEVGDALRLVLSEVNPYIRIDESGVFHLRLQRFSADNLPVAMELELSAGDVIAMAGDYFTQADWTMYLDLNQCANFINPVQLGEFLIAKPVANKETSALITAYNNLAAPDVTRKQIDRIYAISNANYIPFSSTLNSYVQQLMLAIRVKNYGEMLTRNQTHFTPWAIRVYILGHTIALLHAQLAFELKQWANDPNYKSSNINLLALQDYFTNKHEIPTAEQIVNLAHQYHTQALSIELFTFHYYTDHYATGHMSMVGDLRVLMQTRFGVWGSILANNLHDEINRVGVFTNKPYDPVKDPTEPATRARGDGKVDTCLNSENKRDCIAGMTASLQDINDVLSGAPLPAQNQYGGLNYMPDVDYNTRQHKPLLILNQEKIYYRSKLSKVDIISPSEYEALRRDPRAFGYIELSSTWQAFKLVAKLRLFPYLYTGKVQALSQEKEDEILADERQRTPQRQPIPPARCATEIEPSVLDWNSKDKEECVDVQPAQVNWRSKADWNNMLHGLNKNSILTFKQAQNKPKMEPVPLVGHSVS